MSYTVRLLGKAALALSILAIGSTTRAGYQTETKTISLTQTSTDFTTSLAVSSFDSHLGTLVNVVISYTDSGTMNGYVTNTSHSNQNFKVTENASDSLSYGSTSLLTNHLISQQSYSSIGAAQSAKFGSNTPTGSSGPTMITSGPLFEAFLQPSSKVMLTFSTLTTTTVIGGGGNVSTGIYTTLGATVTVVFTYTPATAVPEPASLAMTAIGGIAIVGSGFWRKRRNLDESREVC